MASKVLMPGLNMNLVAFHGENDQPKHSHSLGQVCLPNKTGISSSRRSVIANNNSVATPAAVMCSSVVSKTTSILSDFWREFQGCNDWENMVEPLHPVLRKEIIRYGEFVAACYKVFDLDPNSKRYLNCKYGKRSMLNEVGLGNSGYEVTKYIYATPDVKIPIQNGASCGRWIGYVAVSSDETVKKLGRRDVLVTFRGTVTNHEWLTNFKSSLTIARLDPHNPRAEVKVESGFLSLYTSDETDSKFKLESCREQLLSEVSRLLNKYKHEDLSITLAGHSMGSALALLLAYDITELGLNKTDLTETKAPVLVTVFSFGGPRVGNSSFKQRCEELGVKVLRIVNVNDPITKLPGVLFNENFRCLGGRYEFPWSCSCYAHVGVELAMDFFNMHNPSFVHDLEAYISLLKWPKTKRVEQRKNIIDVDLLNKARDFILSAQNFNMNLPWKDAATNIVNMVQSQKT